MRLVYSISLLTTFVVIDILLFDFGKDLLGYKPNFPSYARFEIFYHYPVLEIYIADRRRLNGISQEGRGWQDTFDSKKFLQYSSNSDSLVVSTFCSDSLTRYMYFYEVKNDYGERRITYKWLTEEEGRKFFERNGENYFPNTDTNPFLRLIRFGCLIGIFFVHREDFVELRLKFRDWRR